MLRRLIFTLISNATVNLLLDRFDLSFPFSIPLLPYYTLALLPDPHFSASPLQEAWLRFRKMSDYRRFPGQVRF